MDTQDAFYKKFDVRLRLFIFEMIAVATLMTCVLPYIVISSRLNEQKDALVVYFVAVVVYTIFVVLSAAYPISRLTRPIRDYFDALETSRPDPSLLIEVRARSLNLPTYFTLAVIARHWAGCVLIAGIMWKTEMLTLSESFWLLVRSMLSMTPGFVCLYFICERIIQPVRQSVMLHCHGLRGTSREKVIRVSIQTRFFLIGIILMSLHLAALGMLSYQQLASLQEVMQFEPTILQNHAVILVWIITLSVILASLISVLAARSISVPLRRAASIMEAVGKGNLDLRVDVLTNDELANLGESFNTMVDQLQESQRQLRAANEEIRALNRGLEQKVLERTSALQIEASKNIVILQSIADGVLVFNARKRAILANKAVENILGLSQNEILGHDVDELVQLGGTREEVDQSLAMLTGLLANSQGAAGAAAGGAPPSMFVKFRLGDRVLAASLAPISEPTPELRGGLVAVYRDITEEEAAIELARRNNELAEANRLKSQFLATMSHELRTPMNSIIGYCQVLLRGIDGDLNDEQTTDVRRIMESGQNLLALINDILDISKIDAGRLEIRTRPINFETALASALCSVEPLAIRKSLRLEARVGDDLPQVWADEDRLRQVMMNLLSNAIKFTREGRVLVEAREEGDQIQICVADTGVGIDPTDHQSIFDEFFQVDGSRTREFGGTGLGLAITKRLVELMGGSIWLDSALGRGSRFYFTVPVYRPQLSTLNQAAAALPEGGVPLAESPPAVLPTPAPNRLPSDRVILAIDDDPTQLDLLGRFLGAEGYRVMGVQRGGEGLRMARDVQPMAIILDLILPDSRGLDLLRDMKADPLTAAIPVIVLSVAEAEEEAMALGATAYLSKPVDRELLLRRVQQLDREGARVLVVDDDSTSREILGKLLGQAGYQVQTARGGEEALNAVREHTPQVMILDLMMLPITGFDVLARMQERSIGADVHVVVLTAKELTASERQVLEGATDAILQKSSTSPEELLRVIRSCLTRIRSSDRWTTPPRPPISALPANVAVS